jgi:hypothetical protein
MSQMYVGGYLLVLYIVFTTQAHWKHGVQGWKGWKRVFFYSWLKRNHEKHHRVKGDGKGNYNVTLPGGDWILGTM